MQYQGLKGEIYDLEENRIAGGGEGSIYGVVGDSDIVAKVFREDKRTSYREEKLCCMIREEMTNEQRKYITWPLDVIYDRNGFVGYIMSRVSDMQSLTALYSTEKYDLKYRLFAAINVCVAVEKVHEAGQICGDLNPQNILINLNETDTAHAFQVMLVDADSYHYVTEEKVYRCEVGLADYMAPEIQKKLGNGRTLRNAPLPTYTKQTDLFALAVHIFCLLMNGCHPFACAKEENVINSNIQQLQSDFAMQSVVAPQPIDNIKNGFFPFYEKRPGIVTPVYAPEFSSLPNEIQKLFVQTFVDGHYDPSQRVMAEKWISVLKPMITLRFTTSFDTCVKGHLYFSHLSNCPYCQIDRRIADLLQKTVSFTPKNSSPQPEEETQRSNQTNAATDRQDTNFGKAYYQHFQQNNNYNSYEEDDRMKKDKAISHALKIIFKIEMILVLGICAWVLYLILSAMH